MSYFRPDLNFDTASEKELEVRLHQRPLQRSVAGNLCDLLGVHLDKKLLG